MATKDLTLFRVFLSSPGDVREERAIALALLDELNRDPEFSEVFGVRISAWDDPLKATPMDATRTPQLSVIEYNARPSECDLTIVIVYGRLGTVLPPEVRRPDGSAYPSGTAWEIEDARAASRPAWLFRRTGFTVNPDDPKYQENLDQYQRLKEYLATFTNQQGALTGGINTFAEPKEFGRLLHQQIRAELRRRGKAQSTENDGYFRIFLADAPEELRTWRTRLKTALAALPAVEVLADVPPPLEFDAHAARVRIDARRADLCVHLLGKGPGAAIEDSPESTATYPVEQLRLCFEHARSQLVLCPDSVRLDELDSGYRQVIDDVRRSDRQRSRLELATTNKGTLITRVVEKKEFLMNERATRRAVRAGGASPSAFVDVHEHDLNATGPLLEFLRSRLRIFGMASRASELEKSAFEQLVSNAQFLIVVSGEVASDWVTMRLEEAAKIDAERDLGIRFGIYVRPGAPAWRGPLPNRSEIINNANGFDDRPIREFLERSGR